MKQCLPHVFQERWVEKLRELPVCYSAIHLRLQIYMLLLVVSNDLCCCLPRLEAAGLCWLFNDRFLIFRIDNIINTS